MAYRDDHLHDRRRRRQTVRRRRAFAWAIAAAVALAVAAIASGSGGRSRPAAPKRPPYDAGIVGGAILIADRGNDRIMLVDAHKRIRWLFPSATDKARGNNLYFNDDSFVGPGGHAIVANEEENHTIVSIDVRAHTLTHLYGQPGVKGAGPNQLNTPDDAYPLPDGSILVADAYNCRILKIRSHAIVSTLGQAGNCTHDPPRAFGAVNGDTPLADGGILVSEIPGHWVDDIGPDGRLRAAIKAPVGYPSDPQPLSGGRILLADYSDPGGVVIIDETGQVLWRYAPATLADRLNHPSLALQLPNGLIAVNDDYRHRVVLIDPKQQRIVWQYGHTDVPGTGGDYLNTPDGMDFVPLDAAGQPRWAAVHHP